MSNSRQPVLDSATDIVPHASLQDVAFLEESVRRADGGFDDMELPETDENPPTQFNLLVQHEGDDLYFRLTVHVATKEGEIRSDAAGHWKLDGDFEVPDSAALEFGNKVAVFTLFPYLRESVHHLSARVLRKPLLLPMIRQGEMEFSQSSPSENSNKLVEQSSD